MSVPQFLGHKSNVVHITGFPCYRCGTEKVTLGDLKGPCRSLRSNQWGPATKGDSVMVKLFIETREFVQLCRGEGISMTTEVKLSSEKI